MKLGPTTNTFLRRKVVITSNKVSPKLVESRSYMGTDSELTNEKIAEGIELISYRQKQVKLADIAEAG